MLEQLTDSILRLMDILLGWLLRLPSDARLFAIALGSALVLTAVRAMTTNQDLLRRCKEDKTRLKSLLREAKKSKDRAATKRYRATLGIIALKQFRQEGRPLLWSLLPIALLATWAFHRLEFHPPKAGQPVEFTAYFPISAAGRIAHLAPADGVTVLNGWIQEIAVSTDQGPPQGVATWRLTAEASAESRMLRFRFSGTTYEHALRTGAPTYEPAVITHDGHLFATEAKLSQVKLFGIVPGIPRLFLAPWLVAYILIVIPGVPLLKRVFKVY